MRYLIVTAAFTLLAYLPQVAAQDAPKEISISSQPIDSTLKNKTHQSIQKGELFIVGKNEGKNKEDFLFKMGERVHIKATGEVAKRLRMELEKTGASRTCSII